MQRLFAPVKERCGGAKAKEGEDGGNEEEQPAGKAARECEQGVSRQHGSHSLSLAHCWPSVHIRLAATSAQSYSSTCRVYVRLRGTDCSRPDTRYD